MTTDLPGRIDRTGVADRPPLAERALAARVHAVPPSGIRRFFDILATMDDVISLGRRRARLRHAAGRSSRPASSRLREGRTHYTSNHGTIELRRALARPSRAPLRRPYDPATEILITVGASEALDLALRATCDPGDEVILHEPSYVAYIPAIVFAGGTSATSRPASRTTSRWIRRRSRPPSRRGPRRSSSATRQPDRRRPARRRPGRARGHRRAPRPARLQRRDLRPPGLRRLPPSGVQRAARDARADDPHGRLLEGLRDDRLAGRLRRGAGGHPRGHASRSTSTGSCPPRRRPRTPRSAARHRGRGRRRADASPSTTAAAGCSSTASTRWASRRSSRAAPSTPSRGSTRPGSTDEAFAERLLTEERVAVVPGQRVRAVRRRARPDVLRDLLRAARGGAPADRPVRRARPRRAGLGGVRAPASPARPSRRRRASSIAQIASGRR